MTSGAFAPTTERGRRFRALRGRSLVPPVVVAGLVYVLVGYGVGLHAGRTADPTYFIKAGRTYLAPKLLPPDPFIESSTGYDGQFFFYLAQDPLLNGKAASRDEAHSAHIDSVSYRYQRILLPALGWLTSWGDPGVLQWTLPLINVIAVLMTTYLLAGFLRSRDRSPWIALVFALSIGMVVGVVNDLSDPLAAALFVAGVVWWLERRTGPAILVLAACLLARETYLLPVALICLTELVRTRGRGTLAWLIPLGVFGVWQLYIRLALAGSPTLDAEKPSIVPLLGAARKAREVLKEDVLGAANWELLFVGLLLALVGFFAVRTAEVAHTALRDRGWPSREQLMPVVALATLLLVPFLTLELWRNTLAYTRYSAPAAGLLLLSYAIRHDRWSGGLLLSVAALSLTNPVVGLLPNKQAGLIKPPPSPQQARVDGIVGCLAVPGWTLAQSTDAASNSVKLTVTPGSEQAAHIYVFDSPEAAAQRGSKIVAIATVAGSVAKRTTQEVLVYPKTPPPSTARRIEGCLRTG